MNQPEELCEMCGNTGRYPVGNSGSESDGYATEYEDCECDFSLNVRAAAIGKAMRETKGDGE